MQQSQHFARFLPEFHDRCELEVLVPGDGELFLQITVLVPEVHFVGGERTLFARGVVQVEPASFADGLGAHGGDEGLEQEALVPLSEDPVQGFQLLEVRLHVLLRDDGLLH